MKHRYFVLALALSAFAIAACSEKETYTPGPQADGFHFSTDVNSSVIEVDESMNGVDVFLYRSKTAASETKKVTIVDESGLFFAANPTTVDVAFAAGEGKKAIHIPFAFAELKPGKEYPISFSFTGDETPYGPSSLKVSILSPLPWIFFAKGVMIESPTWWGEEEEKEMYYQQVSDKIRFCKVEACFGHDTIEAGGDYDVQDYTWYWNTETNEVYVPLQYMGYTDKDGYETWIGDETSFYDAYWNAKDPGKNGSGKEVGSEEWFEFCDWFRAKYPRPADWYPYYDGNGVFYLADGYLANHPGEADWEGYSYYMPGGGKYDSFVCAGFPDLELEASYRGMFVDPEGNAVPIIDFAGGADVEVVKYAITDQDTAAEATLEKLVAGDESLEIVGTAEFVDGAATISPALEPGTYRLVAVPYVAADKDEPYKTNNAIAFDFYFSGINTEIPEVEAQVITLDFDKVFTAEQIAYYGMTKYNSFAWAVLGTDIKSGKYLVSKKANFGGAEGDELAELVITYGTAFKDSGIADINGQGYANGSINLAADTEYLVAVYLENKYGSTGIFTATYTTDPMPYTGELVIGDYLLGEDCPFTLVPTDVENKFTVNDLFLENGTEFNAVYDPEAHTVTLDGTELGYEEQYGNNFGSIYGYANTAKTAAYGYYSYAEGEDGDEPLVFAVDPTTHQISSIKTDLEVAIFVAGDSGWSFYQDWGYWEADTPVTLAPAAASVKKPAAASWKSNGTLKFHAVASLDIASHKAVRFPAYAPKGSGDWSTPARKVVKIALENPKRVSAELK